jgi:hypothetical protein
MVLQRSRVINDTELELRLGGTSLRVNAGVLQRSVDDGVTWTAAELNPKSDYIPDDHGMLGWTGPPYMFGTALTLAAKSQLFGVRVYAKAGTVSAIGLNLLTIGVTLTSGQNKAAFFNSAGTLMGTSVDQSTAWSTSGSTGYKACNLVTPVAIAAGYYDIVFWANGSTAPSFARAGNSSANNAGLPLDQTLKFFKTSDTSVTTDAPTTLGTKTADNPAWWASLVGA